MIILAVDDKQINNKVIELDVEEYMEDNNIKKYKFVEIGSGKEAIEITPNLLPDIIFLDLMMPEVNGFDVLKAIRAYTDIKQPKIIMVTAINDDKMRSEAKQLGADNYIAKPFDNQEIYAVLDKYIQNEIENIKNNDEDFFDFDGEEDEDFFDFDDDSNDSLGIQKEMMDDFNKSHIKVSAKDFLKDYETVEYFLNDIEDLEEDIYIYLDELYDGNLEENSEKIESTLISYAHFLNTFIEFQELATSLNLLARLIVKSNFNNTNEKKRYMIAEFVKSILKDLIKWKDHVFVEQDAVDVFYLNASLLNSCIQLENILREI
ncbi:MAG: hypothetical protein DRG78_02160 [Epsilonproteobacteria bacterium]|nr:MAG: hypothetical protein DRG78_02160 [Campylobacterota bacterium]